MCDKKQSPGRIAGNTYLPAQMVYKPSGKKKLSFFPSPLPAAPPPLHQSSTGGGGAAAAAGGCGGAAAAAAAGGCGGFGGAVVLLVMVMEGRTHKSKVS